MASRADHLVADYLRRLDAALRGAPGERRRELLDDIREHIDIARAKATGDPELAVREALERLGAPEEIAAEAWRRTDQRSPSWGALEVFALILLLLGGLLLVGIGWFVGVALLWSSKVWSTCDKLVGTFLLPGGLLFAALLALRAPVAHFLVPVVIAAIVVEVGTTIFLARRLRRRSTRVR